MVISYCLPILNHDEPEICWMNWKNERYNEITNITINDGDLVDYTIKKTVEECVANYPEL